MMKFDKWWENEHPVYDNGNDTIAEYTAAQKGWGAALKWVLEDYRCTPDVSDIRVAIRDELELND